MDTSGNSAGWRGPVLLICIAGLWGWMGEGRGYASERTERSPELSYYLPVERSDYDPAIPTPEDYFGFQVGEWHLFHHQVAGYIRELEVRSPRIQLVEYARTHGGRPLLLAIVTSESNHDRLDEIRERHLRLADPGVSGRLPLEEMPAVINMGYSIHGNEPSPAHAAVLTAYHLAAARDPDTRGMLEQLVILIDPCLNPDGLDRFAHWANANRGHTLNPDRQGREHNEPVPNGRTNYYWFDLNRDWLPLQHPSSRGRLQQFHRWLPNVLLDFHEMDSDATYFFQPGIPSRVNPWIPEKNQELTRRLAGFHAEALDALGSLYFTEERFDDFYVGKGSTLPDLHGSVGILFEQSSSRGHLRETIHGPMSFSFTIRNQVATSLSSLKAVRALRPELLNYMRSFYRESARLAGEDPVKGHLVHAPHDPARLRAFLEVLAGHAIEFYLLEESIEAGETVFPAGEAVFIPTSQKNYRYLAAILERRTDFEDSSFYDISTWTLPLAFGLLHAELPELPASRSLVGQPSGPQSPGLVPAPPARASLAYLVDFRGYFAHRALGGLLRDGIRVYIAREELTIPEEGGKTPLPRGTLLVPLSVQQHDEGVIHERMKDLAREDLLQVWAIDSSLTPEGIDLGSPNFVPLSLPRIGLLAGPRVNPLESGEVWHLLDHRFRMPVTLLSLESLQNADLSRYSVLVLPGLLQPEIPVPGLDRLRQWIEEGGTLIAIGTSVTWAVEHELATAVFRKPSAPENNELPEFRPYARAEEDFARHLVRGAIFEAHLDLTHPLGYGFTSETVAVMRNTTIWMQPSHNPYSTPLRYSDRPLLSGYISPENLQLARGSASALISGLGEGRTILMVDNPNFRAFWYGANRLFLNACFLGNHIREPAGSPFRMEN